MRKLVYLTIKELSPMAEDVIIVTSSLTKGVWHGLLLTHLYRILQEW
jgi:hypothetical protein